MVASCPYWNEVDEWAASHHTYDELRKRQISSDEGLISWAEYCAGVAKMLGEDEKSVAQKYQKHQINPEVIRSIGELDSHEHVLLSNASHTYLLPIMRELGLDRLFKEIFVSSQIGYAKPDLRSFQHVLQAMGYVADKSVMVDDLAYNVEAAQTLDMKGLLYSPGVDISASISNF